MEGGFAAANSFGHGKKKCLEGASVHAGGSPSFLPPFFLPPFLTLEPL